MNKIVVSIVVFQGNRPYIGQRLKRSDNFKKFGFPGGKVEETDPDLETSARRELAEEMGIQNITLRPLGPLQLSNPDFGSYISYGFVAVLEPGVQPVNCEPHKNRGWYRTSMKALMKANPDRLLPGTKEFALRAVEQTVSA